MIKALYSVDKKPTEVSNLAKRRNVYAPSTLQLQKRVSGSFSLQHGPQTPTYHGLKLFILFNFSFIYSAFVCEEYC